MEKELLEQAQAAVKEKLNEAVSEVKTEMETKLQEKSKEIEDLKAVVEKQGEQIKLRVNSGAQPKNEVAELMKLYQKAEENGDALKQGRTLIGRLGEEQNKAWTSTNTISVDDHASGVYPGAGVSGFIQSSANGGHNWKPYFSQFLGFIDKPSKKSQILDLIDLMPLVNGSVYAFVDSVSGSAAVTEECSLKPIVKPVMEVKSSDAKVVAAFWKTTRQMLKFYPLIMDRFKNKVSELVNETIPTAIISAVQSGAASYSSTGVQTGSPTTFDAIISLMIQVINTGYTPNAILMNPVDYANMILAKDNANAYRTKNGGSINVVGDAITFNGETVPYFLDSGINQGDIVVGDLKLVKGALDSVVDFLTGYNNEDDFRRNLVSFIVEKFFAILIADNTGIVKGTIATVLTDIDDDSGCDCPDAGVVE